MITIGCAGFPVPATRYFQELLFVEVPDTHVAQPGTGTLRRWRREAPPGFTFSLVAPREAGQEGFRASKVLDAALRNLDAVARDLDAQIFVFTSPPEFAATRANKAAVAELLGTVRRRVARVVWEPPPSWDAGDAHRLSQQAGATAARDPLAQGVTEAAFAYYRLPGPAGHKSRYEDPAIERLAGLAAGAAHEHAIYVFANVDMFTDARRLTLALEPS